MRNEKLELSSVGISSREHTYGQMKRNKGNIESHAQAAEGNLISAYN